MVASTPVDIPTKITQWRGRLGDLPEDQRPPTTAKLDALATVADQANAEGDALARQFLEANRDPDDATHPPNDDALEARERAIAGMLGELFTIFEGEDRTATWLSDMRAYLPGEGDAAMDSRYVDWATRIAEFKIGNQPDDERLWADGVLSGTRTTAQTYIANCVHARAAAALLPGSTR